MATTYCVWLAKMRNSLLLLAVFWAFDAHSRDAGPLLRIVDGDTYEMLIEGFPTKVRLANADTPESGRRARCAVERSLADRATDWVAEQFATRQVAVFPSWRLDKYRRPLVRIRLDGQDLGDLLVGNGLARPYHGERRLPWCS